MFARSIMCFATAALVAGLAMNSAFAVDSRPSASSAETVKATRLQVEVNCQDDGDRSYGTYGFGGYGCAKADGEDKCHGKKQTHHARPSLCFTSRSTQIVVCSLVPRTNV